MPNNNNAQYVNQVRPFADAVENAADYCINHDILAYFLTKKRAEAIAVSIFEYDEEKHIKNEREAAYRRGNNDGLEEGELRLLA